MSRAKKISVLRLNRWIQVINATGSKLLSFSANISLSVLLPNL